MVNVNGRGIKKVVKQPQKEMVAQIKITPFNVYNKIVEYEFDHPKIVFSQVMVETGNLKRIKNNNLFGFRYKTYLKFETWEDCVKYAKKWQDKKYIKGDYYSFLKKIGYAEDSLYISKIKRMEKIIFNTNLYGLE
jgi:poly(A) polymerase Pap1